MQLLLLLLPAKFSQPGTISVRGTVLYRASSFNRGSCSFDSGAVVFIVGAVVLIVEL